MNNFNSLSSNRPILMSDIPRHVRMGHLHNNIKLSVDLASVNAKQTKFFFLQGVEAFSYHDISHILNSNPSLSNQLGHVSSQLIENINYIPVLNELPKCYDFLTSEKTVRYFFQPSVSAEDYFQRLPTFESFLRITSSSTMPQVFTADYLLREGPNWLVTNISVRIGGFALNPGLYNDNPFSVFTGFGESYQVKVNFLSEQNITLAQRYVRGAFVISTDTVIFASPLFLSDTGTISAASTMEAITRIENWWMNNPTWWDKGNKTTLPLESSFSSRLDQTLSLGNGQEYKLEPSILNNQTVGNIMNGTDNIASSIFKPWDVLTEKVKTGFSNFRNAFDMTQLNQHLNGAPRLSYAQAKLLDSVALPMGQISGTMGDMQDMSYSEANENIDLLGSSSNEIENPSMNIEINQDFESSFQGFESNLLETLSNGGCNAIQLWAIAANYSNITMNVSRPNVEIGNVTNSGLPLVDSSINNRLMTSQVANMTMDINPSPPLLGDIP